MGYNLFVIGLFLTLSAIELIRQERINNAMTKYTHNGWEYNCIDISSQSTKVFKVYRTKGHKQTYLHFKNTDKYALYSLVKSAENNQEAKDIIENYFLEKQ